MEVPNTFFTTTELAGQKPAGEVSEVSGDGQIFDEFLPFSTITEKGIQSSVVKEGTEIEGLAEGLSNEENNKIAAEDKFMTGKAIVSAGLSYDLQAPADNPAVKDAFPTDGLKTDSNKLPISPEVNVAEGGKENSTENIRKGLGSTSEVASLEPGKVAGNATVGVKGQQNIEIDSSALKEPTIDISNNSEVNNSDRVVDSVLNDYFEEPSSAGGKNLPIREGAAEVAGEINPEKTAKINELLPHDGSLEPADDIGEMKSLRFDSSKQEGDGGKRKNEGANTSDSSGLSAKGAILENFPDVDGKGRGMFKAGHLQSSGNEKGMEYVDISRSSISGQKGEVKIELAPPSLGRLQIELSLQDNQLKALFLTDSHYAKSILDGNMQGLKNALSAYDLNLESFDVMTGGEGKEKREGERLLSSMEVEMSDDDFSHDAESFKEKEQWKSLYMGMGRLDLVV